MQYTHNHETMQCNYVLSLMFTYLRYRIVMMIPAIAIIASNGNITSAAMVTALIFIFSRATPVDTTLRYISSSNSGPGFCGSI